MICSLLIFSLNLLLVKWHVFFSMETLIVLVNKRKAYKAHKGSRSTIKRLRSYSGSSKSASSELDLDIVCGSYQDKKIFYLKPTQSVILTFKNKKKYHTKCHLELRLPSQKYGFSVFIAELNITSSRQGKMCGSDFVQFGR